MKATAYGMGHTVQSTYADTVQRTRAALAEEGFGVITEIDVRATMQEKLGIETDDYVILGACIPKLARRALAAEPELGLLLPCNVVVYATDAGTRVSAIDPKVMMGMVDNPVLAEIADEVRTRLERALAKI